MLNSRDTHETQVLIIGAGISGLEAARLLKKNGVKTLVIEARDRTGGRIHSIKTKNGHVVDLGAQWIHGVNGSIPFGVLSNPIWDIVQEARIPTRATTGSDVHIFNLLDQNIAGSLSEWFDEFLDYVTNAVKTSTGSESLQYYANEFISMKNFTGGRLHAFVSYLHTFVEGNEGAELKRIIAKGFIYDNAVYQGVEPVFHETGFHSVIDYISKDLSDSDIQFNQIVDKITYGQDVAEVHTTSGNIYRAEYVLLTVPLGVLKGRQITFDPPLPEWKLKAIDRIGFGTYNKVIFEWDKAWWNSTNYYMMRVSSQSVLPRFLINANKWNDRPVLVFFFLGDDASSVETQSDQRIVEDVHRILTEMFPNLNVPMPTGSYITRWKSDPFSNGSYTYLSLNQTRDDMIYIGEPVLDRLLFAGESTSNEFYGYAHGALQTARREVTRLLFVYNLLSDHTESGSGSAMINTFNLLIILSIFFGKILSY